MAETLVKRNAELNDTINLIVTVVNQNYSSAFVQQLTKALNPTGNKLDFMRRLFDYVCRNVRYELDPQGREKVFKPSTTVANGKGDCKKMTVLIASVLKAAGIEPLLKHVYYSGENYTHVYVIVPYPQLPNYVTLDPVNDCKFNQEVKYSSANIYDLKGNRMDLYTGNKPSYKANFKSNVNAAAGGIESDLAITMGCNVMGATEAEILVEDLMSGIGASARKQQRQAQRQERRNERKEKRGERKENRQETLNKIKNKIKNVVKKVGIAPARAAFLTIVRLNLMKIANKLAAAWIKDKNKVTVFWQKVGGDVEELKKVIMSGSKQQITGIGQFDPATQAIITAATPILVAAIKLIKDLKAGKDEGGTEDEDLDELEEDAIDGVDEAPEAPPGDDEPSLGGFDVTALLQPFNLFKFGFIYFPAAAFFAAQHPIIFVSVCALGIADTIGILPKYNK
jgi:hypothetical protein